MTGRLADAVRRRTLLILAAGALGLPLVVSPASASTQGDEAAYAMAGAPINTYALWNGRSNTNGFGCGGTTTSGQVITVPDGLTTLDSFATWVRPSGSGSMVIRAEIYDWDGAKAAGAGLYESAPLTLDFHDNTFHKLAFDTGGVPVTAGAKYVLFISADKDVDQCEDFYSLQTGSVKGDVYAGGHSMYLRSFGRSSDWTTQKWHHPSNNNDDDAVKVFLS